MTLPAERRAVGHCCLCLCLYLCLLLVEVSLVFHRQVEASTVSRHREARLSVHLNRKEADLRSEAVRFLGHHRHPDAGRHREADRLQAHLRGPVPLEPTLKTRTRQRETPVLRDVSYVGESLGEMKPKSWKLNLQSNRTDSTFSYLPFGFNAAVLRQLPALEFAAMDQVVKGCKGLREVRTPNDSTTG
jgi:hypothetical protein